MSIADFIFGKSRDVFLVEKAAGLPPVWVEEQDFGQPQNYETWHSLRRASVPADLPLSEVSAHMERAAV